MRQRIAVIGSGISGLVSAWLLARTHEVTLYEARPKLGGHANTVDVSLDGHIHPVDTGFLVFNERTYPNLTALFAHFAVPVAPSEMSFSVGIDESDQEWAGTNLAAVFARPRNLITPRFLGMLADIVRFNRAATRFAECAVGSSGGCSLGEFLEQGRYSRALRDEYLLPMAGAIWSCPTASMLEYPMVTFARFCANHGLLQLTNRPQWRTVRGGSREYVDRVAAAIPDIRRATPVRRVDGRAGTVRVSTDSGVEIFEKAVLACHSDQALALLEAPTAAEHSILGRLRYQPNRAFLHTDTDFLPRRSRAHAAWNYRVQRGGASHDPVGVTYLLNRLQPLPFTRPVMLTMNPPSAPSERHRIAQFEYDHPLFDSPAIEAQSALHTIQGRRGLWFCGAWAGHGFHEDGLNAALAVANSFGEWAPWQQSARSSRPRVLTGALAPVSG